MGARMRIQQLVGASGLLIVSGGAWSALVPSPPAPNDIAGTVTGGGNPTWRDTHRPAMAHAVCVEQLLHAGARCTAKTVTDELEFSLSGDNHFYGTPLNPRAPERVPGGSSSGSASAVASGLVDFALGTDTGGSVRVPASNCGLYGLRPSHGFISLAGVIPFAPGPHNCRLFPQHPFALPCYILQH